MTSISTIAGRPVEALPIDALHANPRNARTHDRSQLRQIARAIRQWGFNTPILIDDDNVIIAGHGRWQAARQIGLSEVPTIRLSHLSSDEKRAYVIADNRLALLAGWEPEILAIELQHLIALPEIEIEAIGFSVPEIDLIIEGPKRKAEREEAPLEVGGLAISKIGDLWHLGPHRVTCGDSRDFAAYVAVLGDGMAQCVFSDPPYNVGIRGNVTKSERHAHREFAMGVGEMSEAEFTGFLAAFLRATKRSCDPGAVIFTCMDWRHQSELMAAWRDVGLEHLNTCVWIKDNGGLGSFYRSAHEFVAVLKVPGSKHRNNVELGKHGRNRTNVWSYPSANSFSKANDEGALNALHSTVKPLNMVADALLDVTARGERVLDPFLGSGTTLIAAEKVGRICHGIELDPLYVDVAIRRWQRWSGERAIHAVTGKTFDQRSREIEEAAHG